MHKESYLALLDPVSSRGKFRKATATTSLSWVMTPGPPPSEQQWAIEDAHTLDDETGQVRLVVDLTALVTGNGSTVTIYSVMYWLWFNASYWDAAELKM
jgi:hypothetical protein